MNRQELQNSIIDYDKRVLINFSVLLNRTAKDTHDILRKAFNGCQKSYKNLLRLTKEIEEGLVGIEDTLGGVYHIHPESEERVDRIKNELSHHGGWCVRELAEK